MWDRHPLNGYFDLTSVRQGTHTILIRQKDFQDYTQAVYVQGGNVVTVNAQLSPNAPSPIPDTTGQIIVVSTPAGAELFLDNTFRGVTPVTLSDIPAGSHVVMARQAGYADASQTVTVTGGQSTPVALGLAEIPVTTKTPLSVIPVIGAFALARCCSLPLGAGNNNHHFFCPQLSGTGSIAYPGRVRLCQ